ncbi:TPA: hypothetical protein SPA83_002698 [Staphylococcus aureus]|nr:hypothetical protein [Staphylococcus aureus]
MYLRMPNIETVNPRRIVTINLALLPEAENDKMHNIIFNNGVEETVTSDKLIHLYDQFLREEHILEDNEAPMKDKLESLNNNLTSMKANIFSTETSLANMCYFVIVHIAVEKMFGQNDDDTAIQVIKHLIVDNGYKWEYSDEEKSSLYTLIQEIRNDIEHRQHKYQDFTLIRSLISAYISFERDASHRLNNKTGISVNDLSPKEATDSLEHNYDDINEYQEKLVYRLLKNISISDERIHIDLMNNGGILDNRNTDFTDSPLDHNIKHEQMNGKNVAIVSDFPVGSAHELEVYFSQFSIYDVIPISLRIKDIKTMTSIKEYDELLSNVFELDKTLNYIFKESNVVLYFVDFSELMETLFERFGSRLVADVTKSKLGQHRSDESSLFIFPFKDTMWHEVDKDQALARRFQTYKH